MKKPTKKQLTKHIEHGRELVHRLSETLAKEKQASELLKSEILTAYGVIKHLLKQLDTTQIDIKLTEIDKGIDMIEAKEEAGIINIKII